MLRRNMLAMTGIGLALSLATLSHAEEWQAPSSGWKSLIAAKPGWRFISQNDDSVLFQSKRATSSGDIRTVTERTELQTPIFNGTTLSVVAVVDYDCASNKKRTENLVAFPQNNLHGAPLKVETQDPTDKDWKAVLSGATGALALKAACSATPSS